MTLEKVKYTAKVHNLVFPRTRVIMAPERIGYKVRTILIKENNNDRTRKGTT
jgi:hypothetical protein